MDIQLKKKHPVVKYKYYILTGLAIVALIIYLTVSMGGPSKLRYSAENLQIVEVKRDKFMEYIDLEGIAQPKMTIKINSLETGTVDSIVAEEGNMLKQRDVILILKNIELQRTIEDERDELDKKKINYEEKLLQMERQSSELRRTILKTVYDLERMSKQYELDKEEYQMGVKSKAELDMASDEFNFQQTNTKMLLSELKNDSLRNVIQVELMKNDMAREEKRYLRSRERLDQLTVRAPINGQLSFISAIYGEKIGAGASRRTESDSRFEN
jgi:multidrug efflux pump subunit AcrA (membrane-fusion protein)